MHELARSALEYALAVLVPVLIAFTAAWLRAQIRRLDAQTQSTVTDTGLALAEAAVIAVEAEAQGQWDGPTKRALAEARLREQGAAFAIPYLEQAVALCQARLDAIAARWAAKRQEQEVES